MRNSVLATERDQLDQCDETQGCFAENSSGKALLVFVWILPVYNLLVYRAFGFIPDFGRVGLLGVQMSDLYLLLWLAVVLLPFVNRRWRMLASDGYVFFFLLNVIVAIVGDWLCGVSEAVVVGYVPGSLLLLTVYLVASQTCPSVSGLRLAAKFSIGFYMSFAMLQVFVLSPLEPGRVNSVFSNANFYAFNMLHLFFLLHLLSEDQDGRGIMWRGLAIVGIVMSRTRSVIFLLPVLSLLQPRSRAVYGGCLVASCAMFFCPAFLRMDDLEQLKDGNARVSMWQTVIERAQFDLWSGAGTGAVQTQELLPVFAEGRIVGFCQPQNHYILLLVERGVLGLVLWCTAIIVYVRRLWPWRDDPRVRAVFIYIMMLLTIQLLENDIFVSPLVMTILGVGTMIARSHEMSCGEALENRLSLKYS